MYLFIIILDKRVLSSRQHFSESLNCGFIERAAFRLLVEEKKTDETAFLPATNQ